MYYKNWWGNSKIEKVYNIKLKTKQFLIKYRH